MISEEQFTQGLFNMTSRRFGSLGEILVKRLYSLQPSGTSNYDLVTNDGQRVEVKFSRAYNIPNQKITEENILEQILENQLPLVERAVSFNNSLDDFNCIFEQIKPNEFDILMYGIFFSDIVVVFNINKEQLENVPNYSNKQHRNSIDEGQFHINKKAMFYHLKNFHCRIFTYDQVIKALQ